MKKQRNYCSHSSKACHLKDSHSSKQRKSLLKYSAKRRGKVGIQTNCLVYWVGISSKLFVSNCVLIWGVQTNIVGLDPVLFWML